MEIEVGYVSYGDRSPREEMVHLRRKRRLERGSLHATTKAYAIENTFYREHIL